jgi:hypothetical protein
VANNDSHPADDLAKAFQGLFNGDNVKQALRDAWDRVKGGASATVKPPQQMNWTPTPNAEQQKALDANAAARIRAKAAK